MRDADEARQLKAHLDEALVLLGNSVEERFSPGLAAALGRTWFKSVRPKQGSFARYDFVSYADCLLGETELTREHRDLFRQVAGVPWAAYGRELAAAKHARNEITHPNQIFNRHSATRLMGELAGLAQALELSSAQALMATADAMRAGDFIRVSRIEPAHEGERAVVREIEAQLAREREEKAAYAERVRDADERLATQEAALALARERGHREVELLRSTNAALESAEYARADQARLERESRAHEQAAREANERAATSAREAKAAKDERDRLVREVAASQKRISELETQTASRLGPHVVADEASLEALQDRVVALEVAAQLDLAHIVRSGGDDASRRAAAQRVRIVGASPPVLSVAGAGRGSHSIRPGQKWPFGAGERSYSLRPRSRDVYEYETDTWLSDVIGKANAHEVVERLAKHRPEGGTIRVDSDGDVSSQRSPAPVDGASGRRSGCGGSTSGAFASAGSPYCAPCGSAPSRGLCRSAARMGLDESERGPGPPSL